jgi:hypothetical protein
MVSGFTAGAQYMFSITAARRTWEANNSQRAPIPVGVSVTVGGVSVGSVTRNNEDPASSTGNGIGNEVGFVWTTTILGPFTASATGSLCLQISATTALWYGGNNTSDGAGGKDISTTYGMAIQSVDIYPYVSTPVRLLYFKVVKDGSEVDINWQTASEINNDYFTVEKSINGIDFTPVATVDGAGNSQSTLNYQTTDYAPYNGISYYRLKQTDFDGTVSYSKIIAVNIEGDENINIYPNPGTGIFNIQGFGKESEITVHNPLGQTILIKRTFSDSSEIDLTSQPSGVYYIKTNNGDTSKSTKIILNK